MNEWLREYGPTILLVWPIVTAVVSTFYRYLDTIPRVHAFLGLLVAFGFDLPSALERLRRLVAGAPPPPAGPGPMGSNRPPPMPPTPPPDDVPVPPVSHRGHLFYRCGFLVGMLSLAGCAWLDSHANVPVDGARVAICIIQHRHDPPAQIVAECGGATEDVIRDVLSTHDQAAMADHVGCR